MLQFEWDEEKALKNRFKHGVSFEEAVKIFSDSDRIEIYDTLHSGTEDRYITIGKANRILFVVYTDVSDEKIRFISARYATSAERKVYYDHLYSKR